MTETAEEMAEAKFQQLDSRGMCDGLGRRRKQKPQPTPGVPRNGCIAPQTAGGLGASEGRSAGVTAGGGACLALGRETAKPALVA